jgi:catechol 2,3-dioxygenase-like lactoylglutathione lyase family enzyme
MLGNQRLIAFLATRDSARARPFYEDVCGMRVVSEDPFALVCDANGTMVRMQKVETLQAQPFTALGWEVSDIAGVVDELVKRGAKMERYEGMGQDERGVWTSPSGARVAWFKDPDGNTLSLTQM